MRLNLQEGLKLLIKREGYTYEDIKKRTGMKYASGVSDALNKKRPMRVDTLYKILGVLEIEEIVLRSSKSRRDDVVISTERYWERGG